MLFAGDRILARIHGNNYWNIKGQLDEKLPIDEIVFDPLLFTLSSLQDYDGNFTGTIGRGEIFLTWTSGATINGRSSIGDYEVKGQTHVDHSP